MKEKLIASFLVALTVIAPIVSAASNLGQYPTFLATDHTLGAYVVVGETAATADVVGAINLAIRLAELSYEVKSVSGTASSEYTGIMRDGIDICTIDTTTTAGLNSCNVTKAVSSGVAMPAQIKNTHYSTLKDGAFTWRSTSYTYAEQVDIEGVIVRHKLAATNVNGTEKMVIGDSDIKYEYVFKKTLTGTGSPDTPNYTYPIDIELLGKKFTVVGVDSDSILMLTGSVCTGVTATNPCVYGDYSVYTPLGGTTFVSVSIKDKDGKVVGTDTVSDWSSGTSKTKTFSSLGLDVTVTSISALTEGTVVGVNMVVGPTGTTTHDYDTTADVESTGSANEAFPGAPRWGIQFSASGCSAGTIGSGSKIQVVYKPSTTEYYVAGQHVSLPNNYGELGFEGWNTDDFATITIGPYGPVSVYNDTDKAVEQTYLYGIEISSNKAGVIYGGTDYYSKAYVLFNASNPAVPDFPVVIAWPDTTTGKLLVADNWRNLGALETGNGTDSVTTQYAYATLNSTYGMFWYSFKINNGEKNFYVNVQVGNITNNVITVYAGDGAASKSIDMGFQNYTSWDKAGARFEQQFIKLGATINSAEATEVNATTEASTGADRNAGARTQDIVDDTGLILLDTKTNAASDKVVFKVPSKALAAKLYLGVKGATTPTENTYNKIVPVTSTVAVLDSDVMSAKATYTAKNLVLVGGPCKNTVVADLAATGSFPYTCANWPARNFGLIKVIDDAYNPGKVVVVVAGTTRTETKVACAALQLYDTKLVGQTASTVEVTGTVDSPVITAV